MSRISLKFANKDGRFCLCAHVKGTGVRHYKTVEGLKNPNFTKWNPDAQMFISRVQTDLENNIILQDLLSQIEQLLDEHDFDSGKELFAMFDSLRKEKAEATILKEKQEITLGEFIKEVIEELRHPVKRKPSSNFQPYTTLLHKLEKEGKIGA